MVKLYGGNGQTMINVLENTPVTCDNTRYSHIYTYICSSACYLDVSVSGARDEELLIWIERKTFDGRVVGLKFVLQDALTYVYDRCNRSRIKETEQENILATH